MSAAVPALWSPLLGRTVGWWCRAAVAATLGLQNAGAGAGAEARMTDSFEQIICPLSSACCASASMGSLGDGVKYGVSLLSSPPVPGRMGCSAPFDAADWAPDEGSFVVADGAAAAADVASHGRTVGAEGRHSVITSFLCGWGPESRQQMRFNADLRGHRLVASVGIPAVRSVSRA